MKRVLAVMIIGMGLNFSAWGVDSAKLPDPTTFAVKLETGDLGLARQWLDAGLDPNFLGSRIGTGLMIGAWEGNLNMMALFHSRGADINRTNANGESAIALAAWNGRQEAVKWLLERGASLNPQKRQWTALHYAVFGGHKELAHYLVGQGADVNALSTNGSTPLMMAIYEGHEDLAKTLLEKGANPSLRNDWNEGALEWAMRFNRMELARRIASSDQYAAAMNEPKEKWGEPKRSLKMSAELQDLLRMREVLVERGLSPQAIDNRIAAERARIVRSEFKQDALPPRAAALEITAKRKAPQEQSAAMVYSDDGKPQGYKVPAATFSGKPRMPPKVPTRNY